MGCSLITKFSPIKKLIDSSIDEPQLYALLSVTNLVVKLSPNLSYWSPFSSSLFFFFRLLLVNYKTPSTQLFLNTQLNPNNNLVMKSGKKLKCSIINNPVLIKGNIGFTVVERIRLAPKSSIKHLITITNWWREEDKSELKCSKTGQQCLFWLGKPPVQPEYLVGWKIQVGSVIRTPTAKIHNCSERFLRLLEAVGGRHGGGEFLSLRNRPNMVSGVVMRRS